MQPGLSKASDNAIGTREILDFFRQRLFAASFEIVLTAFTFKSLSKVAPGRSSGPFLSRISSWQAVYLECLFQMSGPGMLSL